MYQNLASTKNISSKLLLKIMSILFVTSLNQWEWIRSYFPLTKCSYLKECFEIIASLRNMNFYFLSVPLEKSIYIFSLNSIVLLIKKRKIILFKHYGDIKQSVYLVFLGDFVSKTPHHALFTS